MASITSTKPKLQLGHVARLAGFPIGLGLTSVLMGGTFNRVMVAELGMPVSLVGLFFAVPLLVSPARAWLGYRSDGFLIGGLRREPYIMLGWLVSGLNRAGGIFSAHAAENRVEVLAAKTAIRPVTVNYR